MTEVADNGGRRPTLRQVAQLSGVSLPVASLILSGRTSEHVRYSPATAERVRRVARQQGYRPNRSFQHLMQRRHGSVGLLLQNLYHLDLRVLEGISAAVRDAGQLLVVERVAAGDDGLPTVLAQHSVDGLLVAGAVPDVWAAETDRLGIPTVWVNSNRSPGCGVVYWDEVGGMELAVEHLAAKGRKHLLYAHPVDRHFAAARRLELLQAACANRGLAPPLAARLTATAGADPQPRDWGQEFLTVLTEHPEIDAAVLVDGWVPQLYRTAGTLGRRVPQDLAVVGINDTLICRQVDPWVTAIGVDHLAAGRIAVEMLGRMIGGTRVGARKIPYQLTERESTQSSPG